MNTPVIWHPHAQNEVYEDFFE